MQVFQSSLGQADRPCAPADCPRCGGQCKLHGHGSYQRHADAQGQQTITVRRFLCPRCRHTWSIIPPDRFPYRSIPVPRFERLADHITGLAGDGARPPPATRVEAGCVRRGLKKLSVRIPLICNLLGQLIPVPRGKDIGWFWRALRQLGPTTATLESLALNFKTSLLACYRSLKPPWQRENVHL